MSDETLLLSNQELLLRLDQMVEHLHKEITQPDKRVVVGIRRGGAVVAEQLWERLNQRLGMTLPIGFLDVAFYRDDHGIVDINPVVGATDLTMDIDGRRIILVDDVIFTGRTIRAALNALFDYGRPEIVNLIVLADRGGRQLPIQPDFCGITAEIKPGEIIKLVNKEEEGLVLVRRRE